MRVNDLVDDTNIPLGLFLKNGYNQISIYYWVSYYELIKWMKIVLK
jgi:hypothetical protein